MLKEGDPFAVLQPGAHLDDKDGGQYSTFKLAPNFEMAMYVAQATGASIVTDHPIRWKELLFTILMADGDPVHHLSGLAKTISRSRISIAQHYGEIVEWWWKDRPQPHVPIFRDAYRYLRVVDTKGEKPNFEQHLMAQFSKAHEAYESTIRKADLVRRETRIECAFPKGGIYDSTISRLLLTSSAEHHVQSVPMAFFINIAPTKTT
jgi:hypothetical protein